MFRVFVRKVILAPHIAQSNTVGDIILEPVLILVQKINVIGLVQFALHRYSKVVYSLYNRIENIQTCVIKG
jgi:hypothetical protein